MNKLRIILFSIIASFMFTNILRADADLEKKLGDMQEEIDALSELIEEGSSSGGDGWYTKTSLGGYGEIHWSTAFPPDDEKDGAGVLSQPDSLWQRILRGAFRSPGLLRERAHGAHDRGVRFPGGLCEESDPDFPFGQ